VFPTLAQQEAEKKQIADGWDKTEGVDVGKK
jgi:hypothetical protein